MRSPVFRRPGCRRHAGTTDGHPKLPPRRRWQAVIAPCDPTSHTLIHTARCTQHHGGSDSPAPPPGCDLGGTPPRPPRMSPRPRVAKYGATHGANHLRGWRLHSLWSSSPHRRRSSDCFPVGRRYKDTTQIVVKFGEIDISGAKTIFNVVFRRIFAPRTL